MRGEAYKIDKSKTWECGMHARHNGLLYLILGFYGKMVTLADPHGNKHETFLYNITK